MRIGIDCRLWNESGVGRYVRNLVEQLQIIDQNNNYVLFVGRKDRDEILKSIRQAQDPEFTEGQVQAFGSETQARRNDNFSIVNADVRWHTLEEQLRFPEILNRESLDLVHFPYFSVPVFYNKPYVVTIHDLILHHFPTGLASNLPIYFYKLKLFGYKFVIKRAAQNAKKIITVSNATKSEIVDHLGVPEDKAVVTYEGASLNEKLKISGEARSRFARKSYFLYVGNAYPHKNLERLIEAFMSFCHPDQAKPDSGSQSSRDSDFRQNDTKLVLVGKEDYFYKRLKQKVKKMDMEKSVLFYGEVSDEELAGLYKNAKAFVMPSLMEGFGLPGLEAMANKCLVLSSDIPSLKEIYGNAAVYFDPYDIKDLVRKMDVILGDSGSSASMTKRDKIEKGLERVKFFSWEKMAKETLRVYESYFAY